MKDVRGEVLRDSSGSVRWIRAGGRVYRRLEA